jgi:hypothetical protein
VKGTRGRVAAADTGEAAAVRRALSDGYRLSDGILGDDAFVARVTKDAERSGRGAELRAGPRSSG